MISVKHLSPLDEPDFNVFGKSVDFELHVVVAKSLWACFFFFFNYHIDVDGRRKMEILTYSSQQYMSSCSHCNLTQVSLVLIWPCFSFVRPELLDGDYFLFISPSYLPPHLHSYTQSHTCSLFHTTFFSHTLAGYLSIFDHLGHKEGFASGCATPSRLRNFSFTSSLTASGQITITSHRWGLHFTVHLTDIKDLQQLFGPNFMRSRTAHWQNNAASSMNPTGCSRFPAAFLWLETSL